MSKTTSPVEKFLLRYSIVILVVLGAGMLSAAIFLSYNAYIDATTVDMSAIETSIPTNFDQATIDHIESLHESNDNSIDTELPDRRINPFSE